MVRPNVPIYTTNCKKIATRQDKRVSKASGMRIRPNSGAVSGHRGDLGGPDIFLETKTRMETHDYLQIKSEWIEKAKNQAFAMNKPIYALVIAAGDEEDYVVIEHSLLVENNFALAFQLLSVDDFEKNKSEYRISLSRIDQAIFKRRNHSNDPPCYRFYNNDKYGLTIMYLDDFMNYYNRRQT